MKDKFCIDISAADELGISIFKYALFPEEKFVAINSCLVRILGYACVEELEKENFDSLFFNIDAKDIFIKTVKDKKNVRFFEALLRTKECERVCVAITARYIVGDDNQEYLEGIIEDISARKRLEEKLYREKDFFQNLLDSLPDAVYFKDVSNRIIKVNKFYAQGFNMHPEEIIGRNDFDFFPSDQAQRMYEDDNHVLNTGRPIVGKIERTLLPEGLWNQVITTKIPIYDRTGEIIGTMGITRDMTEYASLEDERLEMFINAVTVLVKALEMRDPYTFSHVRHVADIAEKIAGVLGWDENRLLAIRLAGELHDLGKISIPLDILNKPGKLSDSEYSLVQEHVVRCRDLIKDVEFPFSLAEIVYQHHERQDGSGYPRKLRGDEILMEARILAVSDVLEAMACYRPYREALGLEKAMEELDKNSGLKYDSEVVDIVREMVKENNNKVFWK